MHLKLSEEVATALGEGKPVVALESSAISHGLPFPVNRDTALSMEAAVRESGAVPATIALLKGEITVGLSHEEIEYLAQLPTEKVRKCSRRDFAIATASGEDAATTVAGTMIVASAAGIRVFATGGIGGVHRGQPYDVSADLVELGRTPVAVVSSGVKAILDLPLTLEMLETQGVPVIGLGVSTLPAFYSRDSGLPIDTRVETPLEAAKVVSAAFELELGHGILVTVPVPAASEVPLEECEKAITRATEEAEVKGIRGKDVSPFLLERVAELTGGRSRTANLALLINNAKTAGEIACELCNLHH